MTATAVAALTLGLAAPTGASAGLLEDLENGVNNTLNQVRDGLNSLGGSPAAPAPAAPAPAPQAGVPPSYVPPAHGTVPAQSSWAVRRIASPAMSVPELASIDGSIGPTAEATIPLADDGLYRGDGVFEVIRLYAGRPYALDEHLDRLERSAATIELPVEREPLEREIAALLERFGDGDAQLRLVITRGGRRIAATEELPDKGETVALATVRYSPTIILTGVKSLSYGANMQATRQAQARNADEALLVRPDGIVLEAPTSTIFWAPEGGGLRTPALAAGILDSITRRRIVEELEVEEGEYQLEDLLGTSEAFLASTVREVQPVRSVDETGLEPGGPRTTEAREAFDAVIAAALA